MIHKHNHYLQFLDHLNAVGVRYAILHDWESVVEERISDLDIVLTEDDLDSLEASLHSCYRILTVFHYEWSSFGFVLAPKDGDPAPIIVADVITDYRWRGRIFFTGKELLRDRRQQGGYWVVGPRQEFSYLLVKKIYEKGNIPEQQRKRLKQLAEELGTDATSVTSMLFGEVVGNEILDWVLDERWDRLVAQLPQLRRTLRWRILTRDYLNPLRYWLPEIRRRWQRWRFPTGISVALLGFEQSVERKTIEHLKRSLSDAFRRTTVFQGFPGWSVRKDCKASKKMEPGKRRYPVWTLALQSVTRFVRCALAFLIRVRPLLVRSTLVLFEISEDSLLAWFLRARNRLEPGLSRPALHFSPWPNLFLILDANSKHTSTASQMFSSEDPHLTRKTPGSRSAKLPARILLDASLPGQSVAQKAREAVESYLNLRYMDRRHLWFSNARRTSGELSRKTSATPC